MSNKFKVGDKVVPVSKTHGDSFDDCKHAKKLKANEVEFLYIVGFEGEIIIVNSNKYSLDSGSYYTERDLNKFGSKNQRIKALEERVEELEDYDRSSDKHIEALEKEIKELKVIVHQLRVPSTIQTVEDVIEFEGKQYKKVDREAQDGDVIVFTKSAGRFVTAGKPYKVIGRCFIDNEGDDINVYHGIAEGSAETVDVYELHSIPFDSLPDSPLTPNPKSANQQRAEVIEKAKEFVEENIKQLASYDFVISEGLVKLCYRKIYREWKIVVAKCNPSDVFNEHIGKAIALGRALGLDVREFENAVQPTLAIGQIVKFGNEEARLIPNSETAYHSDGTARVNSYFSLNGEIINDTNAEYEVNA